MILVILAVDEDKTAVNRLGCCCVRVSHPTNSYGHTETGPRFKVSSKRLEKPGVELTTPGLQGE